MWITTKGRYGVRLMLELALHYGQGRVLLKEISEEQQISEKYLFQLIDALKSAGLVNSTRGAHGGYMLAKPPYDITLKDIIQVLEGPIFPVECIDNPTECNRNGFCVTRDIWKDVGDKISLVLDSFTLEDMVEKHRYKLESAYSMYNI